MWKNYLKTSFRNLKKHKYHTLNNVLGLTMSFIAAGYIYQYVEFEQSYDDFIPNKEHKVRLTIDKFRAGEKIISSAETYVGCGPSLYEDLPEIKQFTHTYNMAVRMNSVISYEPSGQEPIHLKLKDYYYADSSFLNFFGYELLQGNPNTALAKPNTAVITQSLAHTYFGKENPIGKTLRYQDEDLQEDLFQITGVMKDPPSNTHLPFSLLLSYNTFNNRPYPGNYTSSWKARKSYTYLKLTPESNLQAVEQKISDLVKKYKELKQGENDKFYLQPISNIHFNTTLNDQPVSAVDAEILKFLQIIAVLILLISVINYVNLSTASLLKRAEDVAVRKVLGAARGQLILQYYFECLVIFVLSGVIAFGLLYLAWPLLNDISGSNMPALQIISVPFILVLMVMVIGSLLISGLLPAIIISSFNPIKALEGQLKLKAGKSLRHTLIVGQFAISFALIMATLIVYKQLNYMQSQDLGVDIDQMLVVRVPGVQVDNNYDAICNTYTRFTNEVKKNTRIEYTTNSLTIPGHERAFRTSVVPLKAPDNKTTIRFNASTPDFLETYHMSLLAGRYFKSLSKYDQDSAIVLSTSAVQSLGFDTPAEAIGQMVEVPAFRLHCEVVGVVNDYRLASVKEEPEPMAFLNWRPASTNFFSLRINPTQMTSTIETVKSIWKKTFTDNPIDYFFLDDYFNQQYQQERKLTHLFAVFGGLAIVLAALGLMGLSTFTVQQRTKEIGVRKVMGSSVFQIFKLLTYRFVFLVILSSILGAGAIYYLAQEWLQQFPLQTPLPVWLYAIPLLLLITITLISISYQTLKAARINPVKSLRYE